MRMRCLLTALLLIAVVPSAAADAVSEGQAMAERLCARCHAVGKEGASPLKEAPAFRTFAQKWPIESLAEAFAEGIVTGHPDMPEFKFEPKQIDALLSYLDSVQTE